MIGPEQFPNRVKCASLCGSCRTVPTLSQHFGHAHLQSWARRVASLSLRNGQAVNGVPLLGGRPGHTNDSTTAPHRTCPKRNTVSAWSHVQRTREDKRKSVDRSGIKTPNWHILLVCISQWSMSQALRVPRSNSKHLRLSKHNAGTLTTSECCSCYQCTVRTRWGCCKQKEPLWNFPYWCHRDRTLVTKIGSELVINNFDTQALNGWFGPHFRVNAVPFVRSEISVLKFSN